MKLNQKNYEINNLMSELVKRNGSDLHLTGDSYPFFRIQGQILPASSEKYSSEDLRADLTQFWPEKACKI